jgi:hypothetical protein
MLKKLGDSMKTTTPRKIIAVARIKTDTVYSDHTSDDEAIILLNEAYKDLYNLMSGLNESLFIQDSELTVTDGEAQLPTDCQKLISVYHKSGDYEYVLQNRSIQDRGTWPIEGNTLGTYSLRNNTVRFNPTSIQTPIRLSYLPGCVEITNIDQEIELMGNEDTYLIATLCRDIALREESAPDKWEQAMAMAIGNIRAFLAPRDSGASPTVRDVTEGVFGNFRRHRPRGW